MPDPSLLIVVPTLDSHSLLPRLLASLQQQSWPHWRLLFIDGPSGPAHRHWLEQCCQAEPRCRWIAQDPDASGIFGAMNQGFAAAGPRDWLLFWGSDDWAASASRLPNDAGLVFKVLGPETLPVRRAVRHAWGIVRRVVTGYDIPREFAWR